MRIEKFILQFCADFCLSRPMCEAPKLAWCLQWWDMTKRNSVWIQRTLKRCRLGWSGRLSESNSPTEATFLLKSLTGSTPLWGVCLRVKQVTQALTSAGDYLFECVDAKFTSQSTIFQSYRDVFLHSRVEPVLNTAEDKVSYKLMHGWWWWWDFNEIWTMARLHTTYICISAPTDL